MTQRLLHHLVYQSSVTKPMDEQELQALLSQSRKWNTEHGLTGVLLYCDGDILQVLEGTEEEVMYIFERIRQDCRHHNVTKLADGKIPQRSFSEWSMAFQTINPQDFSHLAGYVPPTGVERLASNKADHEARSLHSLLSTFVHHELVRL